MFMIREKVLALLLIISVFANGYLILMYHPAFDSPIPGVNFTPLDSLFGQGNSSSEDISYVDEFGNIMPIPSPSPTFTPDIGDVDPSPDELAGHGDGEANESVSLPVGELTVTPTVEVTTPAPVDPLVTFTSAKYGFSLRYPRNWTVNEAVAGRTVLTLTAPVETACDSETSQCYKYAATFTVEIDQNPSNTVLEDYFNRAVSRLQLEYSITTTTRSAPALLSNTKAYQIEYYTHDKRGNAVRSFMQYYAIIDGKGYIISYFGPYSIRENVFDHNKGDAQRIIDSISITRSYKPV
jgi:hypothetical protein